jgi:tetratricopeptide (TPR) repeat protein
MNYYEDFENEFDDEYIEEDPNEDDFPSAHENRRKNRDDDENVLFQMEQEARELIEQNQYRQGMDTFEKCIEILIESNQDDPQGLAVHEFFDRTIRFLNEIALRLLQEDKVRESMAVLEKCQAWTNPEKFGVFPALRSLTFNHIGCCYRRLGKLDKALLYLEKALHFVAGMDKVETRGITHINLCAVLSQIGEYIFSKQN